LRELPTEKVIRDLATQYPQMSIPGTLAMVRLMYVSDQMERLLEISLSRHDISLSRFRTLILLHRYAPRGLTATEVADKISVTRGNMTGLLDGLEKSKLIYRKDSAEDRRIIHIHLSAAGQKLLDKILPAHFQQMSEAMSAIPTKALESIAVNLEEIREGLAVSLEKMQSKS
jgi:MarR family 2-MHQ and catechol resistance regulon transcriptional repressor